MIDVNFSESVETGIVLKNTVNISPVDLVQDFLIDRLPAFPVVVYDKLKRTLCVFVNRSAGERIRKVENAV